MKPPSAIRVLKRADIPVDTETMARWLIGKTIVRETARGRMSGRIVETEAYLVGDAAAHSFRGKTKRNQSLFLERGHAYVYFIYGCWFSLNVSGGPAGIGAGVLLRALAPLEGIPLMLDQRPVQNPLHVARGPGCLATALGITRELDGQDLCRRGPLWLGTPAQPSHPVRIGVSTRIGITNEAHRLLRFYETGNLSVSGSRKLNR